MNFLIKKIFILINLNFLRIWKNHRYFLFFLKKIIRIKFINRFKFENKNIVIKQTKFFSKFSKFKSE
jgi:hypothetical protein